MWSGVLNAAYAFPVIRSLVHLR